MWHPPEPSHGLCCGIPGPSSCETVLGVVKHYREERMSGNKSLLHFCLLGEPNVVLSGNSFSSQPTLFSEYFLLLELWLPREQLAWPVSSLFSYLQSPLNEDTKSRVTARLGSQLFTCASQAEDGITRQLGKIRLTCSKGC